MANPAVVVDFVANTRDLSRGMSQAGERHRAASSRKLAGLAKVGAVAGIAALTAAVKIGVDEWAEAAKVTAQTEAVLKSTGGAANVTAKHVGELAESLMKKIRRRRRGHPVRRKPAADVHEHSERGRQGQRHIRPVHGRRAGHVGRAGDGHEDGGDDRRQSPQRPDQGPVEADQAGRDLHRRAEGAGRRRCRSPATSPAPRRSSSRSSPRNSAVSAEAAGKTLPGQLKILQQEFSNVAGALVGELIPPLTTAFKFFSEHKTAVVALAAVLGTLVTVVYAIGFATKAWAAAQAIAKAATVAWTAVQWLLNAALSANPIGLVVIAIAALVVGLVIAYKKSETFRKIVDAAFNAVWDIAKKLFSWFKANWPLLLAILTGPIGIAVLAIVRHWDTIRDTTVERRQRRQGRDRQRVERRQVGDRRRVERRSRRRDRRRRRRQAPTRRPRDVGHGIRVRRPDDGRQPRQGHLGQHRRRRSRRRRRRQGRIRRRHHLARRHRRPRPQRGEQHRVRDQGADQRRAVGVEFDQPDRPANHPADEDDFRQEDRRRIVRRKHDQLPERLACWPAVASSTRRRWPWSARDRAAKS